MNATFLDNQGRAQPLLMGCYGIGVSRTLSAAVEQNNDDSGIIWPKAIAPFDIHVITLNPKKDEQRELGDQLYDDLRQSFDVLYDDRKERAGVKFNDADLIGLPVRVVVGKNAAEGIVEVKRRDTGESEDVAVSELVDYVTALYAQVK